ncbi:MAG: DUF2786 domain-containing protein [Planctomycetes bacterium]|nr:DUF2786 domain-containing protein [Planctomycetota bacterium]
MIEMPGLSDFPEPPDAAANPFLQSAWIRRLRWHYDSYNYDYAGKRLKPPILRIGDSRDRLGEWDARTRAITISAHHILSHPWDTVLDTLRHEMAHQYVEEVLGLPGAPPHGEPFQRACRILRAEPSPAAAPGSLGRLDESSEERDKILSRVKELLALAGSPNEHEAANAMRMANKYLLKYNLDLAELERERRFGTRRLGSSSARIQEYEYTLGHILQDHFFVMVIWTNSYDPLRNMPGRVLEISGTPENLDVAEYVYRYVMDLREPLWREHCRSREARGTRIQYLAGLLRGLQQKLDAQRKELKEDLGLVWLGDPALKEHYRYLYPRVSSIGLSGVRRSDGFHAGVSDGREITIHRGVEGAAVNRGTLLPGRGDG